MKKIDTVRALRDAEYRNSLSAAEQAMLPAHPAGASNIEDLTLKSVVGGCTSTTGCTCGGPPPFGTTRNDSCVPPGIDCP